MVIPENKSILACFITPNHQLQWRSKYKALYRYYVRKETPALAPSGGLFIDIQAPRNHLPLLVQSWGIFSTPLTCSSVVSKPAIQLWVPRALDIQLLLYSRNAKDIFYQKNMLTEEIKICVTQKSWQAEAKSNLAGADTKHNKNRDISHQCIFLKHLFIEKFCLVS